MASKPALPAPPFALLISAEDGSCQSPFGERGEMQQKLFFAAFSGLTRQNLLHMFRALPQGAFRTARERVAQPVEQLTFNQ